MSSSPGGLSPSSTQNRGVIAATKIARRTPSDSRVARPVWLKMRTDSAARKVMMLAAEVGQQFGPEARKIGRTSKGIAW